jgi:hypothetical protein
MLLCLSTDILLLFFQTASKAEFEGTAKNGSESVAMGVPERLNTQRGVPRKRRGLK